jgi:hypothetical protein
MFGFLIRKTIYDMWDNMFRVVLVNLGFIAAASIPVFIPELIHILPLSIAIRIMGIFLCSVYLAMAALSVKSISDYGSFGFAGFVKTFKDALPAGIVMGFMLLLLFLMVVMVIPFYMSITSPLGLVLAAFVFWVLIFALLSFQFYFAVRARLGSNLFKNLKKCLLIFFDNSGLAIFSMFHNILALVLSVPFAFMLPGVCGIQLFLDEALRLRLLKYDWLEANPDANRKKIPWDALLIEEREKTGTRTFRNFIFPWKD